MIEFRQTETFRRWRTRLRDQRVRALIASRLDRLAFGNAGDVKPVGSGISELRIDYGPGYRIYYKKHGDTIMCKFNERRERYARMIFAVHTPAAKLTPPKDMCAVQVWDGDRIAELVVRLGLGEWVEGRLA